MDVALRVGTTWTSCLLQPESKSTTEEKGNHRFQVVFIGKWLVAWWELEKIEFGTFGGFDVLLSVKWHDFRWSDTSQWEFVHVNMNVNIADGGCISKNCQYMTLTNDQTIRVDFSSSLALLLAKLVCRVFPKRDRLENKGCEYLVFGGAPIGNCNEGIENDWTVWLWSRIQVSSIHFHHLNHTPTTIQWAFSAIPPTEMTHTSDLWSYNTE